MTNVISITVAKDFARQAADSRRLDAELRQRQVIADTLRRFAGRDEFLVLPAFPNGRYFQLGRRVLHVYAEKELDALATDFAVTIHSAVAVIGLRPDGQTVEWHYVSGLADLTRHYLAAAQSMGCTAHRIRRDGRDYSLCDFSPDGVIPALAASLRLR